MPRKPRGGKIQVFSKNSRCFAAFSKLRKHCSLCNVPRSKAAGSQHPPSTGQPPTHPPPQSLSTYHCLSVVHQVARDCQHCLLAGSPPTSKASTRPTVTMSRHKAQAPQGGRKRLCPLAPRARPARCLREALGPAVLNSPALTTYDHGQASQP